MPEKISRNDTLLVKYAYLSDGMKARLLPAGTSLVRKTKELSPAAVFAHEADHAVSDNYDAVAHSNRQAKLLSDYTNEEEKRVVTGSE